MRHAPQPGTALRRLLPPGAWLRLVRRSVPEEAAAPGPLLLHRLSGLLGRSGAEVTGHG